jgi:Tfp pilus assembly protein PilW
MRTNRIKTQYKSRKGFTLFEVMLYIGISVILLGVITTFVSAMFQVRTKVEVMNEISQQGAFAIEKMNYALSNAVTISSITNSPTPQITFTVQDTAKSPTRILLNNGIIQLQEGTSPSIPLSGMPLKASNLVFTQSSGGSSATSIQYSFSLQHQNQSIRKEFSHTESFSGMVNLRR